MKVTTGTVRVLIVDDQETFRSAARLVVELADGFDLAGEAATGEEGVDLARDLAPDLVLMDINMPGIDGLEATRRIMADRPEVRVVVLSTYEAAEYESTAIDAGARAFLSKSDFGPDALVEVWERG
jgi:DNA-binding NarL/FixJ family response regulator